MLRLTIAKDPYSVDLGMGIKLSVRPCTAAVFYQARAYMNQKLQKFGEDYKAKKEVGALTADTLNLEDQEVREALAEQYLTIGLARAGIISWEGVLNSDNDEPASATPEKIEELFSNYWVIAENFRQQYNSMRELLEAEKNLSAPVSVGTSETGQVTASSARSKTSRARGEKRIKRVKDARIGKTNSKRLKGGKRGT